MKQLTPGGGGFGDPLKRDVQAVRDDVLNEYISRESALNDCGVVFKDASLDVHMEETVLLRKKLQNSRAVLKTGSNQA